jgi:glutathione synthase/RimK-type ligase-like ATP-grasp enzyme
MKHCAILTIDNLSDFECYDNLLDEPLVALGWQTKLVSWRDKNTQWQVFDAVIIRSPWDYQHDAENFIALLEQIEQSTAVLLNSLTTVRWNIDKYYLHALSINDINIVPTLWKSNFRAKNLDDYFAHFNCQQLVIKPRISANADNTFWLKKESAEESIEELELIFGQTHFMVQPFIESIVEEGEFSLFYFDGQYSHAILKTPKQDDFRVQEEHGGCLRSIEPEEALLTQAKNTLAVICNEVGEMPLYARLDFVRILPMQNGSALSGNSFGLMEAELIEPSLYFNMDDQAAKRFANAFNSRMLNNS